jgi:hypothetical protein
MNCAALVCGGFVDATDTEIGTTMVDVVIADVEASSRRCASACPGGIQAHCHGSQSHHLRRLPHTSLLLPRVSLGRRSFSGVAA